MAERGEASTMFLDVLRGAVRERTGDTEVASPALVDRVVQLVLAPSTAGGAANHAATAPMRRVRPAEAGKRDTVKNWLCYENSPAKGSDLSAVVFALTEDARRAVGEETCGRLWQTWLEFRLSYASKQIAADVAWLVQLLHSSTGAALCPYAGADPTTQYDQSARLVEAVAAGGDLPQPTVRALAALRLVLIDWVERDQTIGLADRRAELLAALRDLDDAFVPVGVTARGEDAVGQGPSDHASSVPAAAAASTGPTTSGAARSTGRPRRRAVVAVSIAAGIAAFVTAVVTTGGDPKGSSATSTAVDTSAATTTAPDTTGVPTSSLETEPDAPIVLSSVPEADAAEGVPAGQTDDSAAGTPTAQPPEPGVVEPPEAGSPTANGGDIDDALEVIGAAVQAIDALDPAVVTFDDGPATAIAVEAAEAALTSDAQAAYDVIEAAIAAGNVSGSQIEALALRYLFQVHPERALSLLRDLAEATDDGFAHLALAAALVSVADWRGAQDEAQAALDDLPVAAQKSVAYALIYRGAAESRLGHISTAAATLEEAAMLSPLPSWAVSYLVDAYRRLGDDESLERALDVLDHLRARPEDEALALQMRSAVLAQAKDFDAAEAAASEAIDLTADAGPLVAGPSHLALANVYEAENDPRAEAEFRAARALDPTSITTAVELSYYLFYTSGPEHRPEAILIASQTSEQSPTSGRAWSHYCRLLTVDATDLPSASSACDRALELDPDNADALFHRARIGAMVAEPHDELIALYERAVEHEPRMALAWNNLCYELAWFSDDAEHALDRCRAGLEVVGLPPDYDFHVGRALERSGLVGEADEHYAAYATDDSSGATYLVWFRRAEMYRQIPGSDPDEVIAFYEKARLLDPTDAATATAEAEYLLQHERIAALEVFDAALAITDSTATLQVGRAAALRLADQAAGDAAFGMLMAADPLTAWQASRALTVPSEWTEAALIAAWSASTSNRELNEAYLGHLSSAHDCQALEAPAEAASAADPDGHRSYVWALGSCVTRKGSPRSDSDLTWLNGIAEAEIDHGDASLGYYLRGYFVHDEIALDTTRSDEERLAATLESVRDLEAAIGADPDFFAPYSALANITALRDGVRGKLNFLAVWERVGRHWPNWDGWKVTRAMLADEIVPDEEEREVLYDDAVAAAPSDVELLAEVGLSWHYRDRQEGTELLRRAIALGTADTFVYRAFAGHRDDAAGQLEARLFAQAAASFGDADGWSILGDRWSDLGEDERAEAAYRTGIAADAPDEFVVPEIQLIELLAARFDGRRQGEIPAILADVVARNPEAVSLDRLLSWADRVDLSTSFVGGPEILASLMAAVPVGSETDPRILDVVERLMTMWHNDAGFEAALAILDQVAT